MYDIERVGQGSPSNSPLGRIACVSVIFPWFSMTVADVPVGWSSRYLHTSVKRSTGPSCLRGRLCGFARFTGWL